MTAAMMLVAGVGFVDAIGRSLREGFFMFWETLWPLVLGFSLAGAVQAFVSREALAGQARRPRSRPRWLEHRATAWPPLRARMRRAPWRSRFSSRAPTSSPPAVFMFASTNLVIELGIVLVVLMGWQFAASEFVGGSS